MKKKTKLYKFLTVYLPIIMLILGIGYANITNDLGVTGSVSMLPQDDIAITSATPTSLVQNYNKTILTTNFELDNASDTKTISVTIKNLGTSKQVFDGIVYDDTQPLLYSNTNIVPNLSGITENVTSINPKNSNGDTITFTVTFGYDDINNITDNELDGTISFHFTPLRTVTYENCVNGNGLTSEIIRSKSFTSMSNTTYTPIVTIDGSPSNITIAYTSSGVELVEDTDYTYSNGTVTFISELTDNITIGVYNTAYFMPYDGEVNLFGLDKANLKSFRRDTTSTLSQVETLYNNGTAVKINNVSNDQYNSNYDIYAWISNNIFYWWSEADVVYWHPDTVNAFKNNRDANINSNDRKLDSLTTIDLTGTNTSKVKNFANWFDSCISLTTITGNIVTSGLELPVNDTYDYKNTTNNDVTSGNGMSFMFNDCKVLTSIDLSGFDTHNAVDMKRMFGGCAKVTSLDLSNFDTSNVKSMHWMFRKASSLTSLDLTSFDTSNVENMLGMFTQATSIKTIVLGDNFNTGNVKYFTSMFSNMNNLTTIYAKHDFQKGSGTVSSSMFNGSNLLVGAAGTSYELAVANTNQKDITYAKVGTSSSHKGYFTQALNGNRYNITYNLDGGSASNPYIYYDVSEPITLNNPTKAGYIFTGWTGTELNGETLNVTIPTGSIGDRTYTAHYSNSVYVIKYDANGGTGHMDDQIFPYDSLQSLSTNTYTRSGYTFAGWSRNSDGSGNRYADKEKVLNLASNAEITFYAMWRQENTTDPNFPEVFSLPTCTFNGSSSPVTNCGTYTGNYINTNVTLFDTTNFPKDFDLYFEISNYTPSNQESGTTQHTIVNSKYENSGAGYPGFVFRRNSNNLEFKIDTTNARNAITQSYSTVTKVRIVRKNNMVLYSFNDNPLEPFITFNNFTQYFNTPVTLGAGLDSSGNPFRHTKVTLSNVYLKLGTFSE